MECWWVQPSSHDGSVHVHSRARSDSGTQAMAAGWDFADIQNQLDGIAAVSSISNALSSACFFEASRKVTSSTTPRTQT